MKKVGDLPKSLETLVRTIVPPVFPVANFPGIDPGRAGEAGIDVNPVMPGSYRKWRYGLQS